MNQRSVAFLGPNIEAEEYSLFDDVLVPDFDRKLFARWAMTWVIEQIIKTSKEDCYSIHSAGQCQWRASKISVLVRNSYASLWLCVLSELHAFRSGFPKSEDELPCDKHPCLPNLSLQAGAEPAFYAQRGDLFVLSKHWGQTSEHRTIFSNIKIWSFNSPA